MSKPFWFLKEAKTEEEALEALKQRDLETIARFYIESCEDKTWITSGGDQFMKTVFSWLSKAYEEGRLDSDRAKSIALAIQKQHKALEHTIPLDIDFMIQEQEIPVSSFMFSSQSPFFRDLIKRTKTRKKRQQIEMPRIKLSFFDHIKEFVATGSIEFLWREEPKYILNFIRQAQKLGMENMVSFASQVYKRYLTNENVIPHLKLAQKEFLKELENECCAFINEQNFGLKVQNRLGEGLEMIIDHILDQGLIVFEFLKKQVTFLTCRGSVPEDSRLVFLIQSIPRLVGFDISDSSGLHEDLLASFPKVKQLSLSNCPWLDDDTLLTLLDNTPGLIKLNLSKNTQLTFRSWGGLASLTGLIHLNLSYCDQLDSDDFDLVATSCPRLSELILIFTRVNDEALTAISRQCRGLTFLDLSDCSLIRGEGLIDLGVNIDSLSTLRLVNCRKIDDESLELFKKASPGTNILN